jgi:hypothetical protein
MAKGVQSASSRRPRDTADVGGESDMPRTLFKPTRLTTANIGSGPSNGSSGADTISIYVTATYPSDIMNIIWKIVIAIVAFLAAIWIASFALELFMGRSYPAWTVIAALVIVSPIMVLLWRDRLN